MATAATAAAHVLRHIRKSDLSRRVLAIPAATDAGSTTTGTIHGGTAVFGGSTTVSGATTDVGPAAATAARATTATAIPNAVANWV